MSKCDWCKKEKDGPLINVVRNYIEYKVCSDCGDIGTITCERCHRTISTDQFGNILDSEGGVYRTAGGREITLCNRCITKKICDWCNTKDATNIVNIRGREFALCNECGKMHKVNVCRICHTPVLNYPAKDGVCFACMQLSEERKIEQQRAMGLDMRMLRKFMPETDMDPETFRLWITGSVKNEYSQYIDETAEKYNAEMKEKIIRRILISLLLDNNGWTLAEIDNNYDDLKGLLTNPDNFDKIVSGEYEIINSGISSTFGNFGNKVPLSVIDIGKNNAQIFVTNKIVNKG